MGRGPYKLHPSLLDPIQTQFRTCRGVARLGSSMEENPTRKWPGSPCGRASKSSGRGSYRPMNRFDLLFDDLKGSVVAAHNAESDLVWLRNSSSLVCW